MVIVDFSPNIIEIGRFAVKWYSLAYLCGILLGWWLTNINLKKSSLSLNKKDVEELFLTYALAGIIVGGRLGYVLFYNLFYYLNNPLEIFMIWKGGMSFHGGTIGVILSLILFAKIKKISLFALGDIVCLITPIGLFFGRLGNFINAELFGNEVNKDFIFAVVFKNIDNLPRHPSQLYEAFLEGLVLFIALNLLWNIVPKIREKQGFIAGIFLLFYGIFRSFIEIFRTPDIQIGYIFNTFTMGQVLCLPMIVFGTCLIFISLKKQTSS